MKQFRIFINPYKLSLYFLLEIGLLASGIYMIQRENIIDVDPAIKLPQLLGFSLDQSILFNQFILLTCLIVLLGLSIFSFYSIILYKKPILILKKDGINLRSCDLKWMDVINIKKNKQHSNKYITIRLKKKVKVSTFYRKNLKMNKINISTSMLNINEHKLQQLIEKYSGRKNILSKNSEL